MPVTVSSDSLASLVGMHKWPSRTAVEASSELPPVDVSSPCPLPVVTLQEVMGKLCDLHVDLLTLQSGVDRILAHLGLSGEST